METSVTLVSCLYWLARTKWQHSGFPPNYDRYSSWSENFLSLDANIVIFTDSHYYDAVVERRKKYDPDLKKTLIVVEELKDLEFYQKYFFKMSVLMSSPQFKLIKHADCADNMYPLYNVVQYNKISLLQQVKEGNPFNSTHLMWMDCGSCREGLDKYKNKKFPTNTRYLNDKIIHFSHRLDFTLSERKQDYFLSQIRNIQGTSWIVPVQHVDKYHELISRELESTMDEGYIGSDEKTYDSIYQTNKDIVELVQCGWFQFFDVMSETPAPVENHNPDLPQDVSVTEIVENTNDVASISEQTVETRPENLSEAVECVPEVSVVSETVQVESCQSNQEVSSSNCVYTPCVADCSDSASVETVLPKKRAWWKIFGGV